MRGLAIGMLVVAYSLAIVQPFLPFVAFQVQRDALADLFCINKEVPSCHGTCYLMSQVRQAPQQTDPATGLNTVRSLAPHVLEEAAPSEEAQQEQLTYPAFQEPMLTSEDMFPETPPPRV